MWISRSNPPTAGTRRTSSLNHPHRVSDCCATRSTNHRCEQARFDNLSRRGTNCVDTAPILFKWDYDNLMSTAYVLMGILLVGGALTCLYIIAECLSWRTVKDADHRAMREIRELYKKLHTTTKPFTRPFSTRMIRRK